MEPTRRIALSSDNLILTPYDFLPRKTTAPGEEFKLRASILGHKLFVSGKTAVLTGFIGYPALLTALLFIEDCAQKKLFFVGTAGILPGGSPASKPEIVAVATVGPDSVLEKIFAARRFQLPVLWPESYRADSVISTDLPLREDHGWIMANRERASLVEMELFALSWYHPNLSAAFVVTSDIVGRKERPFFPRRAINSKLQAIFDKIVRYCHET